MEDKLCPCGSGEEFINCCEVYLKGQKSAESPEKLMRSRYSAFVKGDFDYVKSTWHPDTVPELADDEPNDWIGLEILNAASDDCEGEVEFIAKLIFANKLEIIHEVSDFEKIDGKWLYGVESSKTKVTNQERYQKMRTAHVEAALNLKDVTTSNYLTKQLNFLLTSLASALLSQQL